MTTKTRLALSVCAIGMVSTFALAARAETAKSDQGIEGAATPGVYEHDGLYLRLGAGFGPFSNTLASDAKNADDQRAEGQISGIASVGELMLGGVVAPRWIVGGGVWTSSLLASDYSQRHGDAVPQELQKPDNFGVIGPFADWYFTHRPGVGQPGAFHLQWGAGLALLDGYRPEGTNDFGQRRAAVGAGLMVGAGHEWWVDPQWGLGLLARVTAAGLVENDSNDEYWYHGVATFPAIMVTVTYN